MCDVPGPNLTTVVALKNDEYAIIVGDEWSDVVSYGILDAAGPEATA